MSDGRCIYQTSRRRGEGYGANVTEKVLGKKGGGESLGGDEASLTRAQNEVAHDLPVDSDSGEKSRRGQDQHSRDESAEAGMAA